MSLVCRPRARLDRVRADTLLPITAVLPQVMARLGASGAAVLVAPPGTGKTTLVPLALAERVDRAGRRGRAAPGGRPRRRPADGVAARREGRRPGRLHGAGRPPGRAADPGRGGDHRRAGAAPAARPGAGRRRRRRRSTSATSGTWTPTWRWRSRSSPGPRCGPTCGCWPMSATADAERLAALLGGPDGPAPVIGADAPLFDGGDRLVPAGRPGSTRRTGCGSTRGCSTTSRPWSGGRSRSGRATCWSSCPARARSPRWPAGWAAVATRTVHRLHGRMRRPTRTPSLRPAHAAPGGAGHGGRREQPDRARRTGRRRHRAGPGAADGPRPRAGRAGHRAGVPGGRRGSAPAGPGGRRPGGSTGAGREAEHDRLPAHPEPEIATADLTGVRAGAGLLGRPGRRRPAAARPAAGRPRCAVARQALPRPGRGRRRRPGHRARPAARRRPACTPGWPAPCSTAPAWSAPRRAAEVVALLADDSLRSGTDDLGRRLAPAALRDGPGGDRALARGDPPPDRTATGGAGRGVPAAGGRAGGRWRRARPGRRRDSSDDLAAGAGRRAGLSRSGWRGARSGGGGYLMAGGTAAELAAGTALTGAPWLAVAVADRQAGAAARPGSGWRPRSTRRPPARPARTLLRRADEVDWADGDVVARRVERLGAIVAGRAGAARPADRDLVARRAAPRGCAARGSACCAGPPAAARCAQRLAFCRAGARRALAGRRATPR